MRIRENRWWCRWERDGGQSEGERETRVGRVTGELLLPYTPWHSHNLGESLGFSNTLNKYRQWYILWRIPRFRHRPEYQKMAKVDDVSVHVYSLWPVVSGFMNIPPPPPISCLPTMSVRTHQHIVACIAQQRRIRE